MEGVKDSLSQVVSSGERTKRFRAFYESKKNDIFLLSFFSG
jgi:hypothetical protein